MAQDMNLAPQEFSIHVQGHADDAVFPLSLSGPFDVMGTGHQDVFVSAIVAQQEPKTDAAHPDTAPATRDEMPPAGSPPEQTAAVAPAGTGITVGFTLRDAIQRALIDNPERAIAKAQIRQAASAVSEAKSGYFPQVNLKLDAGREYSNPYAVKQGATTSSGYSNGNSGALNIRQMLFDGFITRETVRQRLQQLESTRLGRAKVSEEIINSTAETYMQVRQYQQTLAAAEENLAALRQISALVDLRAEAGDTSKSEQNYMRARLAAAEQEVINARSILRDAFSALTYLIGDMPEFDAILPEIDQNTTDSADALINQALRNNTDMRLNMSDQAAAQHELKSARGKYLPTLDFVVDGNHADDLGGETGVDRSVIGKLELNIRLFDGGLRSAGVQRQMGRIGEIKARADRIQRELTQNLRQAVNKLQTTTEELQVAEDEITANADLERLYRQQFSHGDGDIDITNLVESQERIFSARIKKAKLESDRVTADIQLRRLVGTLLPEFCPGRCR